MDARAVTRPLLLDLFCGAGGAAMGYHRAGFDVVGVDVEPQPNYPFEFHQGDALELLTRLIDCDPPWSFRQGRPLSDFAAIHASPPCQDHIRGGLQNSHGTGWMLEASRDLLDKSGVPWVIENVPGAPMRADYVLCGSQFGLSVRRHRWFETSWHGFSLMACDHSRPVAGVYGHPHGKNGAWPGMLPSTVESWSDAMGIDWMDADGLREAIPPAYTEHIGAQLIEYLATEAA
jgi:DNA (cytosine-5)-methyltransferase 1